MTHSPKQQNPYVTAIVVTLIVAGIGVYLVPNFLPDKFPVQPVIFQVLSLLCLVAAVFVLSRYKATSFIYQVRPRSLMVEDGLARDSAMASDPIADGSLSVPHLDPRMLDLVVSKKQGNRAAAMECVLGLDCLIAAWDISADGAFRKTADAVASARNTYGTVDLYDYTVTLGLKRSLLLLFRDGEKHVALRLETDQTMGAYLTDVAKRNHTDAAEQ